MNSEWSELNKLLQINLKKATSFNNGIKNLLILRKKLFNELLSFKQTLNRNDFNAIPFINAKGYHCKTISYSIWHIFRIEDIVSHTLIKNDEQIFFTEKYNERIGAPIITTGNELFKRQIADFSEQLDLNELYNYSLAVKNSTDDLLSHLSYTDLKRKMTDTDKARLLSTNVVSRDDSAFWLVDYWCGKDVRGLIQMPFSRHWIMHIEACLRIRNKLYPQ